MNSSEYNHLIRLIKAQKAEIAKLSNKVETLVEALSKTNNSLGEESNELTPSEIEDFDRKEEERCLALSEPTQDEIDFLIMRGVYKGELYKPPVELPSVEIQFFLKEEKEKQLNSSCFSSNTSSSEEESKSFDRDEEISKRRKEREQEAQAIYDREREARIEAWFQAKERERMRVLWNQANVGRCHKTLPIPDYSEYQDW